MGGALLRYFITTRQAIMALIGPLKIDLIRNKF